MRSTSPPPSIRIRILTHNIRYATTSPFPGELPWTDRKAGLVSELLYHTRHCPADIICLQEVLHEQLVDIMAGLNSADDKWSYVGVGRDDGETAGEYSPIIYRRDVWRVETWFTMWLSPTPWQAGSKGWDAASVRIMTAAKLSHSSLATGKTLLATNTHLDDQGSVSRRESAKLIVRTVRDLLAKKDVECAFLTGDLNSEVTGDAYRVLSEEGSGLVDLQRLAGSSSYGYEMTFTGFDGLGDGVGRATKIDFIHLSTKTLPRSDIVSTEIISPERQVEKLADNDEMRFLVQGYAVLPNQFEDRIYISDHRAVVGDVVLHGRW